MPEYNVYATVVGTKFIGKFEAKNKKEAIAKAEKEAYVSLCYQCSSECEDPECTNLIAEKEKE